MVIYCFAYKNHERKFKILLKKLSRELEKKYVKEEPIKQKFNYFKKRKLNE